MKITLLGRINTGPQWLEHCYAGFSAAGHTVQICVTRNPALNKSIDQLLRSPLIGAPRTAKIVRDITRFKPDLILAPYGFETPLSILERVCAIPGRGKLVAWVGDLFPASDIAKAACYDAVAYTDRYFISLHQKLGFPNTASYVPHAASPSFTGVPNMARRPELVFVGRPALNRIDLLTRMESPITIYGPDWPFFHSIAHDVHPGRIGFDAVTRIYQSHLAVLNIANGGQVVGGLNQRSFDPYLSGTPVVSDDVADLPECFEPGKEVLVYDSVEALNGIYARLRREPALAATIGAAGQKRVLKEHTYANRLAAIASL